MIKFISMKIIFMGSPDFAVPTLKGLASCHQILAVYTQPDRPGGRGLTQIASPVKIQATELGLRLTQARSLRTTEEINAILKLEPDVIVVAAYGLLIPRPVLDIPPLGCINVHPSILPRHRGASPVAAAILAGDNITGVSIILLDEGWDTGPILAQVSLPVSATDTTGSLTTRLSELGAQLLDVTLNRWKAGEIKPLQQDQAKATYSHPLRKEDGEIDWTLPAHDLERKVRAFQPWPGCYTRWRGKLLKILESEVLPGQVERGRVIIDEDWVGVGTRQDILGLKVVQLEGKRAMDIHNFVRGQPGFNGAMLY